MQEITALTALTGSDKQIAWATDLRVNALRTINEATARIEAGAAAGNDKAIAALAKLPANLTAVQRVVDAHTDAAWWIDGAKATGNAASAVAREAQA